MRIVLPGALPDPSQARDLLPHLLKAAPLLVAWLERSHATSIVADPAQTYCTAWEYWQLQQRNFHPRAGQSDSAGLGPLLAGSDPSSADDPVWLLELTHMSPSRDGAVLIPSGELNITTEESDALLRATQDLFADTDFSLSPSSTTRWRITLPEGYFPLCPSPELVSTTTVNDWWRQDLADRPWRRLANEVQMLWFDHTVNQKRYDQGQVPINNVWLFGGARPSQLTEPSATSITPKLDFSLLQPARAQDWNTWLQTMRTLDTEQFSSLNQQSEVVLIGYDQIIRYTTENRFWKRWQPGIKESWKKWWSPQN